MNREHLLQEINKIGLIGLFVFIIGLPYSPALSEIGTSIALLSMGINSFLKKQFVTPGRLYDIGTVIFFLLICITLPFSIDFKRSVREFFILRWLLLPYIILNLNLTDIHINRLLKTLLYIGSLFAVFLILQYLLGKACLPYKFSIYQTPTISNNEVSNRIALQFGQYYALFFIFFITQLYLLKKMDIVLLISSILSFSTVIMASARSSLVGIWCAFIGFGAVKERKILYLITGITIIILSFFVLFPNTKPAKIFYNTLHPVKVYGERYYWSAQDRLNMLKDTVLIFETHPLTGIGFGCYGIWTKKLNLNRGSFNRTSSDPMEFLATAGLLGLIAFIVFYLIIFITLYKQSGVVQSSIFVTFLGFTFGGLFEPMFFNTILLRSMMFLIGIDVSLRNE